MKAIVIGLVALAVVGLGIYAVLRRDDSEQRFVESYKSFLRGYGDVFAEERTKDEKVSSLHALRQNEIGEITRAAMPLDGSLRKVALEWVETMDQLLKVSADFYAWTEPEENKRTWEETIKRSDEGREFRSKMDELRDKERFLSNQMEGLLSPAGKKSLENYPD